MTPDVRSDKENEASFQRGKKHPSAVSRHFTIIKTKLDQGRLIAVLRNVRQRGRQRIPVIPDHTVDP